MALDRGEFVDWNILKKRLDAFWALPDGLKYFVAKQTFLQLSCPTWTQC